MGKLEETDALLIRDRIIKRFSGPGRMWDVCKVREQHYYQTPEADPPMIPGYEAHARQTSILRDTHVKYRARMTENEWRAQFTPAKTTQTTKSLASHAEAVFLQGFDELRSQTGIDIQGALADGQGIYGYGVLHAYLADEAINVRSAAVDYAERDELGDDDDAGEWTEDEYPEVEGEKPRAKGKRYRETARAMQARRNKARVGWPWWVQTFPPGQFGWVMDKSLVGEFKYALTVEVIPIIDFMEAREEADLGERGAPIDVGDGGLRDTWRPSASDDETMVTLYRLWARDYIYEMADGVQGMPGEQRFRCISNRCKRVPFWLAPGMLTANNDPVFAYEPILASVYRFKPVYDRYISNMEALAESSAIARYWLVPTTNDAIAPLTDDEGHIRVFSANAAEAVKPPEGYRYERVGGDGASGQYERLGEWFRAELQSILPDTGVGDMKDSTEPWTAQILQRIGNIVPGMGLQHLEQAFLGMCRMIVEVNADEEDGPGDVAFHPKDSKQADAIVVIKPEEWRGLDVEVEIDKISAVERATKMQLAIELMNAGIWTKQDVIEKGEGLPDPAAVLVERETFNYWYANVMPLQMKAAFAKTAGSKFSMQPVSKPGDAPFVDATGRGVMPAEVAQANGVTPMGPQGGNGQVGTIPQPTMGAMPPLAVPGQAITPGVR